ncbi:hypothetical protein A9404_06370 [Halothiobacillus diazotrophicus]|uniref:Uncharacterized protein n=2 Tax=Halothiobacillus diazotrophicus TaxID=1860122 RepID=A0A191ZKB3_9GAMM|nr:hypothetical protein A9404_06370 [Halothiobacillus diazotrophicus]
MKQINYVGLDEDEQGGLTHIGKIIRDGWLFGFIPETQTGAGWNQGQIQSLYEKVWAAWEPYAHLPSRLPPELQEKYMRIQNEALAKAKAKGWDPELEDDD